VVLPKRKDHYYENASPLVIVGIYNDN